MKRRSAWLSFTACALTAVGTPHPAVAAAASHSQPVGAFSPEASLSQVELVASTNGTTAFFDKASGRVYFYDSTLTKCVGVRQVTKLGEPLESVAGSVDGKDDACLGGAEKATNSLANERSLDGAKGAAGCVAAETALLSAESAAAYQPGATPQVNDVKR